MLFLTRTRKRRIAVAGITLIAFVVWGFLVGALYAGLHNLLRRD